MARILFFNIPFRGHMRPTVALAQELLRRGHEVTYYCTEDTRDLFAYNAIPFVAYPATTMSMDEVAIANRVSWKFPTYVLEKAEELTPFARQEIEVAQPDLVVLDAYASWAELAARTAGVPSMTSWTTLVPHGIVADFGWRFAAGTLVRALRARGGRKRALAALTSRYGSDVVSGNFLPALSTRNLLWVTPEFQPASDSLGAEYVLVGASVESFTRPPEEWSAPAGTGPLVVVSLGTVHNSNVRFFRSVVAAFTGFPARFILVVPDQEVRDRLGNIPENFTVYARIPQLRALQDADALIGHGGLNGIQESLNYGVPMVLVPQSAEQAINAGLIHDLGAGIALRRRPPFGPVEAVELRDAVLTILNTSSFAARAKELGRANLDAGGWLRAADAVEELLAQNATTP